VFLGILVACFCRTLQTATLIFPAPSVDSTEAAAPIVANELCREGLVRLAPTEPAALAVTFQAYQATRSSFALFYFLPSIGLKASMFVPRITLQHVHLCDRRSPISRHRGGFPHIDFAEVRQSQPFIPLQGRFLPVLTKGPAFRSLPLPCHALKAALLLTVFFFFHADSVRGRCAVAASIRDPGQRDTAGDCSKGV